MKRTPQHSLFFAKVASFTVRVACAALVCAMVFPTQGWAIGPWQQVQQLTPSDRATTYNFGTAVAVSSDGSTMVAGTPAGKAYVFIKNGTTWTQQQELTTPADAAGYAFGTSVAVSGNGGTIVVGAYDLLICQPVNGASARIQTSETPVPRLQKKVASSGY